jgi:hypothetical protein
MQLIFMHTIFIYSNFSIDPAYLIIIFQISNKSYKLYMDSTNYAIFCNVLVAIFELFPVHLFINLFCSLEDGIQYLRTKFKVWF